jgi:hypothetical protein
MRSRRAPVVLVATVVAVLAAVSSGLAQTSTAESVDVVIAAEDAAALSMREIVVELIARLRLVAAVTFAPAVNPGELITPRAGAEPRVARVWVDLSKPDRATLYLVDREWERILIRHVRKMPGHEELAREAIGHILETAVDALAHGARIGITREEARAEIEKSSAALEPASPAAPREADQGARFEFGALYEAEVFAQNGVIAHGPVGGIYAGAARGTVRPGGWLTLQYRFPVVVEAAPLGVRLETFTARALATIDLALGGDLGVRFGAGPGVDVLHTSPRLEGSPGTMLRNSEDFAVVVARVSGVFFWSLTRNVAIALMVSCDLDPTGSRYVALVDGVATPVLSPWPVRPAFSLGVTFQPFL